MKAKLVDPRYVNRVDRDPTYRVDFWNDQNASEEWRLSEVADFNEVLLWAKDQSSGRDFVIYAEFSYENGHGMIRLVGKEPQGF